MVDLFETLVGELKLTLTWGLWTHFLALNCHEVGRHIEQQLVHLIIDTVPINHFEQVKKIISYDAPTYWHQDMAYSLVQVLTVQLRGCARLRLSMTHEADDTLDIVR